MADIIDLAPKATHKLKSKGSDFNKIYVTKLKAIDFLFFHKKVTQRKSIIMGKVSDMIEDNSEALEATNKAPSDQHIKGNNIRANTELEMEVGEIYEYYTGVV